MKYLLLLKRTVDAMPEPGTPEAIAMANSYGAVMSEMAKAGVLVDTGPLHASTAATVVRIRNGERLLTDVPAAEVKEHLGGYTVIDVDDLDAAVEWAAKLPAAGEASVEIRPVAPRG